MLREEHVWGRDFGKGEAGSRGGRVAVWTRASPHAVGGFFITVLHWMSKLALLYHIEVCFLICNAPVTHQTFSGSPGQAVNLVNDNQ